MKRTMFSNDERRKQRQAEAEERKAVRAARTSQQQIIVLMERGVTSGREVERLTAKINGVAAKTEEEKRAERRKKYKKEAMKS